MVPKMSLLASESVRVDDLLPGGGGLLAGGMGVQRLV